VTELCSMLVAGAGTIDVVVGPRPAAVILAYECAKQLGVRGIFAEEVLTPRRHAAGAAARFRDRSRRRVLLVDDVITTGGSLLAMLPVVEEAAGDLVRTAVSGRPVGWPDLGRVAQDRP
jgi:orotate phosphoribosyltransferase